MEPVLHCASVTYDGCRHTLSPQLSAAYLRIMKYWLRDIPILAAAMSADDDVDTSEAHQVQAIQDIETSGDPRDDMGWETWGEWTRSSGWSFHVIFVSGIRKTRFF